MNVQLPVGVHGVGQVQRDLGLRLAVGLAVEETHDLRPAGEGGREG